MDIDEIRKRAEELASRRRLESTSKNSEEYQSILHELYVHQIELEIQNEELRNTQIHLEYNRNKFAELFNSAPVGFILLDSSGCILEANVTFLEKTGSEMKTVFRKPFHDFMKKDSKKAFMGQYKSFFKNPANKTIDVELITESDDPLVVRLYGSKGDYSDGVLPGENLRVAAIDITAQVEAEEKQSYTIQKLTEANLKIKQQQSSIVEQERLKVLIQMAGATAHELNQPLMYLLGSIDLIGMTKHDPAAQAKHLKNIRKAGERIANITKRIQSINHDKTKPYPGGIEIIQLDEDVEILYVEDEHSAFVTLKKILNKQGLKKVEQAKTVQEAKFLLEKNHYDLIFVDYKLPDGEGFDLLGYIQQHGIKVPVIMITGQGDEQVASLAIRKGAFDYLSKSAIDRASLTRVITNAMEKFRLNREIDLAMGRIAEMSIRDELTGLYNRRYFNDALEKEIARSRRYGSDFSLCMIDIDHFRKLNDQYGHQTGDFVLSEIGKVLIQFMRKNDISCRYKGAGFAIILPHTDIKNALALCERFRTTIENNETKTKSSVLKVTVSIGINEFTSSSPVGQESLISRADEALQQSRKKGGNRISKYRGTSGPAEN